MENLKKHEFFKGIDFDSLPSTKVPIDSSSIELTSVSQPAIPMTHFQLDSPKIDEVDSPRKFTTEASQNLATPLKRPSGILSNSSQNIQIIKEAEVDAIFRSPQSKKRSLFENQEGPRREIKPFFTTRKSQTETHSKEHKANLVAELSSGVQPPNPPNPTNRSTNSYSFHNDCDETGGAQDKHKHKSRHNKSNTVIVNPNVMMQNKNKRFPSPSNYKVVSSQTTIKEGFFFYSPFFFSFYLYNFCISLCV